MNYDKLYYNIINKAIFEENFGLRYKGNGTYYEKHHIIPKSLGGSNESNNLVLLTAREHYLCHWLLVKRNEIGSVARNKMLKAWFMMAACGNNPRPKLRNMNDYAKYRNEMSSVMSELQNAEKNSQWGKHWYTNRNTGECKRFLINPDETWIEGRNLFHGEFSLIEKHIFTRNKNEKLKIAKKLWNEFHSGNYNSIRDFAIHKKFSRHFICTLFSLSSYYLKIFKPHTKYNGSNKKYINKF